MKVHEDRSLYFTADEIHWKPGAKNKDKSKTLLMPYGEMRDYQLRLDKIDPNWQNSITVISTNDRIVCNVAVTLNGITRSATGDSLLVEYSKPSELAGTNAEAQAFKRACSAHGIGRELYFTEPAWVATDDANNYVYGKKKAALRFTEPYGFLNSGTKQQPAPKATKPETTDEVITVELWDKWIEVEKKAKALGLNPPALDRSKVTASRLKEIGKQVKEQVKAKEGK